jgi:hypothetical protein
MDFHQSSTEIFAERIVEFICEAFSGKEINSDECTKEMIIKAMPYNIDDNILEETCVNSPDIKPKKEVVPQQNSPEIDDPIFKDNIKTKKPPKKKSPEQDNVPDKPPKKPRPLNAFFYFKAQPENKEKFRLYAEENDIQDKRKVQKCVWDSLSQEEKGDYKSRSITEFEANNPA